jgi:hypothetical protein
MTSRIRHANQDRPLGFPRLAFDARERREKARPCFPPQRLGRCIDNA